MAASNIVRKRIVVIGGGFAGINAVVDLAKLPVDITLIDRKNHHTFQPLLYQVALAVLSPRRSHNRFALSFAIIETSKFSWMKQSASI